MFLLFNLRLLLVVLSDEDLTFGIFCDLLLRTLQSIFFCLQLTDYKHTVYILSTLDGNMQLPPWLVWYKKPDYRDIREYATEISSGKRAFSPEPRGKITVPSRLRLERILANKTCKSSRVCVGFWRPRSIF